MVYFSVLGWNKIFIVRVQYFVSLPPVGRTALVTLGRTCRLSCIHHRPRCLSISRPSRSAAHSDDAVLAAGCARVCVATLISTAQMRSREGTAVQLIYVEVGTGWWRVVCMPAGLEALAGVLLHTQLCLLSDVCDHLVSTNREAMKCPEDVWENWLHIFYLKKHIGN